MLPTLSAVPQNHCPLLCQDRSLTHRGIHCCWCGHTCLHRASTAATSMAGDVSKVCQTGTSLRTFLLTLFCKGPLLQLHWFCSCKSVSCKQTFARYTCTVHSVCCIQESVILCLQPARNTSTKTPLPEITPRHSANGSGLHWSSWHSSGTEAGAACEETTLQLHFIQADTHHLQPLQVTLFL